MEYVYVPYPAWRYHATQEARIVETEEEDRALGQGWVRSPALILPEAVVEIIEAPVKPKKGK